MRLRALSLAVLATCSAVSSAQLAPEQLLAKMRKAYGSVKTARFDVLTRFMRANTVVISSKVQFMAPMKVNVSTTGVPGLNGKAFTAVTDGSLYSLEGLQGGGITRAYKMDAFEQGLPQFNLETLCFWDYARQLSTGPKGNMKDSKLAVSREMWDKANCYVLKETAEQQRVVVHYYVNPNTFLIMRTVIYGLGASKPRQDFAISKLQINVPLPASAFKVKTVTSSG